MKKRMLALMLAMIMALALMTPAAAFVDHNYLYTAVDDMDNQRLAEIGETTLPALSETWQFDYRVDIVSTTEGDTIQEYAELFYTQYEYGWGENKDGALLMILVEDNGEGLSFADYYIHAEGIGKDILALPESESIYVTLESVLVDTEFTYADAGEVCADAVSLYASTMSSLLAMADPDRAAEVPVVIPATEPETERETDASFIRDNALLISDEAEAELESRAEAMAEAYGCGVYVLTVDTMNGAERREFAKNYYLENDLGTGAGNNGILFMIAMDTRDYVTVTYGKDSGYEDGYGIGIKAFTDDGILDMEDEVVSYLSDGDYEEAFDTYMDICEEYIAYFDENGEGYEPEGSVLVKLLIVIFLPLLIALVVCLIFRSQMKTAKIATEAANYVDNFELTAQHDRYTHTTRERTKIETDNDSGSSVDSDGFGGSKGGKF